MSASDVGVRSPLRRGAIHFIETYRSDVSGRIGARCRFETSCSQYGLDAFRRHSFPVATAMTVTRIARCRRPGRRRHLVPALGALALLVGAVVALPMLVGSAIAQVSGPCTATLNGVDANTASTPDKAIEVQHDAQVPAGATMSAGPVAYRVQLEFAGVRWTAKSGNSTGNSWTSNVDIKTYAKYGVGLYKVHAVSTNTSQTCTVDGYVKVVGKGPLTTAAGLVGGVALAGGVALSGIATAKAAKVDADYDMGPGNSQFGPDRPEDAPYAAGAQWVENVVEEGKQREIDRKLGRKPDNREIESRKAKISFCSILAFPALWLTVRALLSNRGRRS